MKHDALDGYFWPVVFYLFAHVLWLFCLWFLFIWPSSFGLTLFFLSITNCSFKNYSDLPYQFLLKKCFWPFSSIFRRRQKVLSTLSTWKEILKYFDKRWPTRSQLDPDLDTSNDRDPSSWARAVNFHLVLSVPSR